jgi:hypothetical protein
MPSVAEILKASGLTDEQIAALDAKAITAFTGVLSTAEQERQQAAADKERAEIERRSNAQFYDTEIAPALNNWGNEKSNLEAQAAFYCAQNEAARSAGFIPEEVPGFQPRNASGQYVAAAPGGTPGSPTFAPGDVTRALSNGISNVAWALQTHQKLTGEVLPDSFDQLDAEATAQRLPFRDYVARKYDYAGKQAEQQRKAQEEHDAKVRQDAEAAADRRWAEKIGSNPDVRIGQPSRYADVSRAVKSGERPDPLQLNESQRRQATSQAIRKDLAEGNEAA